MWEQWECEVAAEKWMFIRLARSRHAASCCLFLPVRIHGGKHQTRTACSLGKSHCSSLGAVPEWNGCTMRLRACAKGTRNVHNRLSKVYVFNPKDRPSFEVVALRRLFFKTSRRRVLRGTFCHTASYALQAAAARLAAGGGWSHWKCLGFLSLHNGHWRGWQSRLQIRQPCSVRLQTKRIWSRDGPSFETGWGVAAEMQRVET